MKLTREEKRKLYKAKYYKEHKAQHRITARLSFRKRNKIEPERYIFRGAICPHCGRILVDADIIKKHI